MTRLAPVLLAAALLSATAPPEAWARSPTAGSRPDPATDEGGLWSSSDRAEAEARTKAELDADPVLTGYVRDIACKVAAGHCGEIRVYVMDRPFFNAQMAPNGYMEVWSGLLLRVGDEAELAFVLGHETSHYVHHHSLDAWRAARRRANATLALSAAVAVAGAAAGAGAGSAAAARSINDSVNALVDVIYLAAVASLFAFSRDQEEEADRMSFARAVAAGYDPSAGARLWRALQAEADCSDFRTARTEDAVASVFATHPVTAARVAALETLSEGRSAGSTDSGRARYRAAIRPHLADWLRDDLRRRDYGRTLHLIDRLAAGGEDSGLLDYYRGEVYRRRRGDGDDARALAAYRAASAAPDAPPAVWRELGELHRKAGQTADARAAWDTYLARAPSAQDRWLVEASLKALDRADPP